ncbi:uncharacterized protein LOC134350291 [Mobula hypostoma]|uniref:uncharacterized protein LOC134350291 n=1 Tax=Mobula hypostoma TaxID=723540 RepID=UPI002FC2F9ED
MLTGSIHPFESRGPDLCSALKEPVMWTWDEERQESRPPASQSKSQRRGQGDGGHHGCRGVPGAVHNPDLIETAVRSTEEHLEKLLKCPLRCCCYCAMENLRRRRPQILGCLSPVAGVGVEAFGRDGARCSVLESWSEARSFRTDSESDCDRMLPGCCTGKLAALEVHRLREMMGLSRDFETLRLFTVPVVCSLTNYGIALHCCNHML